MKKVVLLTGVLAAGLAATPVTANAAAPSTPNVQEVNDYTPKDAQDLYDSFKGQLGARFDDIANLRNRFEKGLTPFTPEELKYTTSAGVDQLGWHNKAKVEVENDLVDFDHELEDIDTALETLWSQYKGGTLTEQQFIGAAKALLATLISEQYAKEVLPVKYQHLNQDWRIFTEYQELGSKKWAEYYALTQTQAFKEVNETDDVKNDILVEDKSNEFRLFYEGKHANRLQDEHEFCKGDCCLDNLAKIKELYKAFCDEYEAEKALVEKYQKDRTALLEGANGLDAAYDNFLDNVKIDPTTIVSKNGNPDKDSDEATAQLNLKQTEIENAQVAAYDFIQTFNAQMKNADWEAANWVGEGKDIVPGKVLNNKNYNEEATRLIGVVTKLVGEYSDLVKAAELNRDNYDALVKKIKDVDDWNRAEKHHDADELDVHADVKYYESEAFDNEVPAAYLEALNAAEQAYEKFVLIPAKASDPYAEIANTKYNDYAQLVKDANANEGAHDAQHVVLDGLKKTYNALVAEYDKLVDGLLVNDTADHSNIEAAGVNELYPINADHSYAAKATEKAKHNVEAAKGLLDAAYNTANTLTETIYDLGKSVQRDAELQEKYAALNTENGNFRTALDKAIDNEVAFLEGAHLYDATLAQAHHDLDEYAHHPETFGHWNTEIQAVLDLFPPVLAALVNAYDVEADARNYVTNVLPTEVNKLKNAVAELEQKIKDNQTARDANEAAINATLTDLADLKKKYDETHFTTEEDKTGEATALKADFQQAWKDYVANDLQVPALFEAPATESDLHFAQTAVGVDFDADIQAMLSAIKSENSIDFDIHHQATNDYALNLAAVKYIKDVVIPALDKKFDELVKANEDAHKAQYDAYAQLKKDYDCTEIAATAIAAITDPAYEHSKADTTVKTALDNYKKQIDDSYIAGSAKADDATIAGLKTTYENALDAAQKNDKKFVDAYNDFVSAKANVKYSFENWLNNYYNDGGNKCSNAANTDVSAKYTVLVNAANAYLKDIKTDWYNEEAIAKAGNNTTLLNAYKSAVTAYNTAVENAQKNDAELTKELNALGAKIELVAYNGKINRTTANAEFKELYKHIDELAAAANSYDAVKGGIVADWEAEDLIKSAVVTANNNAINNYITSANKYNALMERINVVAQDQFDLNQAIKEVNDLDVVTTKLNDKHEYNEYDKDRQGLLDEETRIQNLIKTLEKEIDAAFEAGSAYNCTAEDAAIDKAIKDLVAKAKDENDKFLANEAAFEPLHTNLHNLINYAEDTTSIDNPAKEAFEKAVAGYVAELDGLVKKLEKAYREEKANTVDADIKARYEELLGLITDSKKLAEEVGKNLGDVNKNGEVDEWDSTGSNPDGIVEIVLYDRAYNKYGDMDLNGANDITDINLLNNLLWHESVYGKKAGAADVEFEGSVDLMVAGNTVALALNNNVAVNGIQFDVTVPAGAKFSSVIGTARAEGLNVLSAKIAEDTYRVLVVSLGASKVINGNDGNLVSFNVSGEGEVEVTNVIATDGVSHKLNGAAVSLGQTTGIDEIATEGNTEIFGLDGIRQNVMKAGVNIVRTANGAVKKIFK